MSHWDWISSLGRASIEGGLMILGVWALCRTWRGIPAWARSGLWWLASARLLVALAPLASVPVPTPPLTLAWWPSAIASSPLEPSGTVLALPPVAAPRLEGVRSTETRIAPPPARPATKPFGARSLAYGLLAVWAAGVAVRLAGLVRQCVRVRRVRAAAEPHSARLASGSRLALHDSVPVPMVTGLWNPIVLLPARMAERPADELRLAVAHELSHVRRGDLWLAWVPALAEALFWFHPLVRLCVREYVQACEEACDEDALRSTGAHPYDYGRLLLALGVDRRWIGAGAIAFGSPNPRQLSRRLSMLERFAPLKPHVRRAALGLLCTVGLMALAPLRLVATVANEPVGSSSSAAVAEDPDQWEDPDRWNDEPGVPPVPPVAPIPAIAPRAAVAPRAPLSRLDSRARAKARSGGYRYSYDSADDPSDRFAYVLVYGDHESMTGSGNNLDWRDVRRLRERIDGDFLWVRSGDRRYLVRDPDVLAQIEEAFAPQNEIGQRQSRLGAAQSRIGAQQSRIGAEQSKIGHRQSELGRRQSDVAEEMARRQSFRRGTDDLEQVMSDLSEQMEALGHEQERLGTRMEPLSRQQEELGAQMEALGRQMEKMSRVASRKVRTLIDEAIQNGDAEPIR